MTKISSKEILEYYVSDKFDPILPDNPNFRHFRFKLHDGKSWRKVKARIRNKEDLIKWIVKLGGCDIYYSTSQWMNPTRISTKSGAGQRGMYHIADNLLINNDLVFDIDAEEPINLDSLNLARKSTNNLYEIMKTVRGFRFQYAAWSGKKGFRLVYKDTSEDLDPNPLKRIELIEQKRKIFINEILKKVNKSKKKELYKIKTSFDTKITENVMCVIRVIGTVHSTTGYISTKINPTELRKPIKKLLLHIPYIGKRRPVIPKREMIKEGVRTSPHPRHLHLVDDVSGLASLPHNQQQRTYFVSNRVLGVKRGFVPFFVYQPNQKKYLDELGRLQKKFKLGPLYVYDHEGHKIVLSLKTMQKRQLQKVLNQSTSRTKYQFLRYKRILAPFLMDFVEKIPFNFTGQLSKGHLGFVEPTRKHNKNNYVGWDKVEIVRANQEGVGV